MHFSETEIEELTAKYKARLKESTKKLPQGAQTLSDHILDWYHAEEHLWDCGKLLFGEKEDFKVKKFVLPLKELLWNVKVKEVYRRIFCIIPTHPKKETEIYIPIITPVKKNAL